MKKLFFLLTIVSFLIVSCEKDDKQKVENTNNDIVEEVSELKSNSILDVINNSLKEHNEEFYAVSLVGLNTEIDETYELQKYIYTDNNNVEREFGVFSIVCQNPDGSGPSDVSDYTVYCTGSCGCALEGVLDGDDTYVQCDCDDCIMHYSFTQTAKLNFFGDEYSFNINDIITDLDTNLNIGDNIYITSVKHAQYSNNENIIIYYEYSGETNSKRMVGGSFAASYSAVDKKVTLIDCYGDCDCRERFFPSSGAVECTCDPCTMKTTTL